MVPRCLKKWILFVLSWTFGSCLVYAASADDLRFRHFSVEEGLSQASVHALLLDNQGFLWIGTEDGLNRFDGSQFVIYRHDKRDPTTICGNYAYRICLDPEQNIWVGAWGSGLARLDRKLGTFRNFTEDPSNPTALLGNRIKDMLWLGKNQLWIATTKGLCMYDSEKDKFTHYPQLIQAPGAEDVFNLVLDPSQKIWFSSFSGLGLLDPKTGEVQWLLNQDQVRQISGQQRLAGLALDPSGKIWMGTRGNGLVRIDPQTRTWETFQKGQGSHGFSADVVSTVLVKEQQIWVGTDEGLFLYNESNQSFTEYNKQNNQQDSLSAGAIRSLHYDRVGRLWVGTWSGGLNVSEPEPKFATLKQIPSDPQSLPNNMVLSILKDSHKRLWIGTFNGLVQIDEAGRYTHFEKEPTPVNGLKSSLIWQIIEDAQGQIWVGGDGGVSYFSEHTQRFSSLPDYDGKQGGLSKSFILALASDAAGIWIGTRRGGLNYYRTSDQSFSYYSHNPDDPASVGSDFIRALTFDRQGILWIGTDRGLSERGTDGSFVNYLSEQEVEGSLSDAEVRDIHQDLEDDTILWIGCAYGLNRFDKNTKKARVFLTSDGLANDIIYGILEDAWGQIWLSTGGGLSVYSKQNQSFRNFTTKDGLSTNEFNMQATASDSQGFIYFGSVNGLTITHPNRFKISRAEVPVALTGLFLNNEPALPGQPMAGLTQVIEQSQSITLQPDIRMMALEFAGLELLHPWRCSYAYQLQGFDKEWLTTNWENRRATYTNLAAGEYLFRVKSRNADGVWSDHATDLKVVVLAPLWWRWWAKLFYLLIAAGLLILYLRFQRQQLAQERAINEQQSLLAEKLRQLDVLKDQFLANTSHELRTPLNGIIGLAESLIGGVVGPLPATALANLDLIVVSGRRLANLVGDILDLSTLKQGHLSLRHKALDLHPLVEDVVAFMAGLAAQKDVRLVNEVPSDIKAVWADPERITQVLLNLVGNAIKFTPKGTVSIRATADSKRAHISVVDTGVGISSGAQQLIFEAFRQADGDIARSFGGTGLGLSITQDLVRLHGSELEVQSEVGVGSEFSFYLSLTDEAPESLNEAQVAKRQHEPLQERELQTTRFDTLPKARVLVVDDEPINRRVVLNHLLPLGFEVDEAPSGETACQKVLNDSQSYDLILLDIMMPVMSGFEVCRKIREIWPMENLTIIFLTARNRVEDLVNAFDAGGSDFLGKPVAREELLVRIDIHLRLLHIHRTMEATVRERSEALILREKMATLGSLAQGVAHEINNPNNLVRGGLEVTSELLSELKEPLTAEFEQREPEVSEQIHELISQLEEQIAMAYRGSLRIGEVVTQMSSFTMVRAMKIRLNIFRCLEATSGLIGADQAGISISLDIPQDLFVTANSGEMHMVFLNLLTNSKEAILRRRQGSGSQEPAEIKLSAVAKGDQVHITIIDSGCGFDPSIKGKIFDAFFTTKPPGLATGLGLYQAWRVVEQHGGELHLDSEPGSGTQVHLSLPLDLGKKVH